MTEAGSPSHGNETFKSIFNRHSIRSFTDKSVSQSDITSILDAANQAPSAHNQQSWRFVIIRGTKKTELVNLVTENSARFPRPTSALLRMAARSIASAPVVIAVMNTGELIRRGPELFEVDSDPVRDFFRIMEIQSSAAAVENMLIAATSLGLASVWLGILIMIQKEVLSFLEFPAGEFMAVVPVGYAQKSSAGPKKKSLDAAVKYLQ
ncbi:MAG TPA: nitroreductase family protein [Chitinivibrionales bacterium]|nr:nitroreductase family protein [Chitinivibrionales bacterium]